MDLQKLTLLLHQKSSEITERTPFCPGDHEIAACFDLNSRHAESALSEHHLINCNYCLARVAVLAQLHKSDANETIPDSLLAVAEQIGHRPRRRLRHTAAWAAAAMVIITLFTVIVREPGLTPGTHNQLPPSSHEEGARQLRNINQSHPAPTILVPVNGTRIRPEDLTIRWSSVPGSLYYDVRVVTAEGFIVWQDRIEANQSQLPADLNLLFGNPYFVRVDAYLAEAKRLSSQHVQFTIAGED